MWQQSDLDRMQSRTSKAVVVSACIGVVVYLGLVVGAVWAAIHFIGKYW